MLSTGCSCPRPHITGTSSRGPRCSRCCDPQRFARGVIPDPAALKQILIRRLKTEITNADGTPRYPAREAKEITLTYPAAELQVQELLADYTRARSAKAAAARAKAKKAGIDLPGLLKKRYFSSPAAFSSTILAVRDNSKRVDLQWPSGEYEVEIDLDYAHGLDEDRQQLLDGDFTDDDPIDEAEQTALAKAQRAAGETDAKEAELLEQLCAWAEQHDHETDAKAAALLEFLRTTCQADGS